MDEVLKTSEEILVSGSIDDLRRSSPKLWHRGSKHFRRKEAIEDRLAEVQNLTLRGLRARFIAQILHVSIRQVEADRAELRRVSRERSSDIEMSGELGEIISEYERIGREAMARYYLSRSEFAQIRFLNNALDAMTKKMGLMLSAGLIPCFSPTRQQAVTRQ